MLWWVPVMCTHSWSWNQNVTKSSCSLNLQIHKYVRSNSRLCFFFLYDIEFQLCKLDLNNAISFNASFKKKKKWEKIKCFYIYIWAYLIIQICLIYEILFPWFLHYLIVFFSLLNDRLKKNFMCNFIVARSCWFIFFFVQNTTTSFLC